MTTKPRIRVKATSRPFWDSLTNVVANLGTSRDKMAATDYATPILTQQTILNAYRGAWLPRKIVDVPALDSCRAWRKWEGQPEEIKAIEAEEHRLGVKGKTLAARIEARLLGGAALLIGTGDSDPSKPLNPDTVKSGGLRYVTHLHMRQLSPMQIGRDPASEWFDKPEMWMLNGDVAGGAMIHASRLVIFTGTTVIDPMLMPSQMGWGDSVLLSVFQAIANADSAAQNVASLVFEAKVDTVGIPDLMNKLGDPGYSATLIKRWALAETGKGINGTLMHDAEEVLGQKQASFNGLPDVLDRFMQLVSGAADIPMTRLLGQSPAGMSATGESDLRNYYDRIAAAQSLEISPAMHLLDECLIRSALGARPEDVKACWNSLWQSTEREKFEIGKMQSEIVTALKGSQLIPEEPLSEAVVSMLTETGIMPGLQAAVEEFYAENPTVPEPGETAPEPADPEVEAGAMLGTNDAAPRSLYVRRDVLNGEDIIAWAKAQGIADLQDASQLHITLAYSKTPVDWMKAGEPWSAKMELPAGGPRIIDTFGKALVILVASTDLSWRHDAIRERTGASWDFPDYQPHITIAYPAVMPDPSKIEPYRGPINLGPEIFEEVNPDA